VQLEQINLSICNDVFIKVAAKSNLTISFMM